MSTTTCPLGTSWCHEHYVEPDVAPDTPDYCTAAQKELPSERGPWTLDNYQATVEHNLEGDVLKFAVYFYHEGELSPADALEFITELKEQVAALEEYVAHTWVEEVTS